MTLEQLYDVIEGRLQLASRSGRKPPAARLNRAERTDFDRAVDDGFFTRHARPNLETAYWHFCEIRNRPFIEIRPARLYAHVHIDMWPCTFNLNAAGVKSVKELIRRFSTPPHDLWLGNIWCGSDRVRRDLAGEMAGELFLVATNDALRIAFDAHGSRAFRPRIMA